MEPLKISFLRCQKYTQISSSHDENNEIDSDNTENTACSKKFKAVGMRIQFQMLFTKKPAMLARGDRLPAYYYLLYLQLQ